MQTSDQTTEQLHQQASAHYLQGKFAEALAVWRRILAVDAEDERAKEGLRLCELLTEDGAIESETAAVPVEQVEQVAPVEAAEAPIEFEVPDLELDLPQLDAVDPAAPSAASAPGEPPQAPDPDRQAEGIEMGKEPEVLAFAGEVPPAPVDATGVFPETDEAVPELPLGEIVDAEIPEVAAAAPAAADPAETELQKRVGDLMKEALAAYNAGDHDTVRSVLARVFILDDACAEAHQLQELIEEAVPSATEMVDVADLDAPEHDAAPGEFDLELDDPEAQAAPGAIPVAAEAPAEAGLPEFDLPDLGAEPVTDIPTEPEGIAGVPAETVAADVIDPLPELGVEPEDTGTSAEVAPSEGKRIRLPQLGVNNGKTRMIVGAVVVLIVAVVGVGFWMKMKDTRIRDDTAPLAALQAEAEAGDPGAESPAEAPAEAAPAAAEPAAPVDTPAVDLQALMAEGREALNKGDYAAAMVAFHAVIEQEPGHLDAAERLQAATDGYKRQQEAEKEWLAAASLFRDGEYRSAMKMFYRLEPDSAEDTARLQRYKRNGWYNMAVVALRSGHCDLARSHLREAEQIDPEDVDVATAQALADSCDAGSRRAGYQRAIQVIQVRGLD